MGPPRVALDLQHLQHLRAATRKNPDPCVPRDAFGRAAPLHYRPTCAKIALSETAAESRKGMTDTPNVSDYPPVATILVPLDNSPESQSALPYAMALATPGTELLLLTVVGDARAGLAAVLAARARLARARERSVVIEREIARFGRRIGCVVHRREAFAASALGAGTTEDRQSERGESAHALALCNAHARARSARNRDRSARVTCKPLRNSRSLQINSRWSLPACAPSAGARRGR